MEIVAAGPPSSSATWVPDVLAVRDGERILLIRKDEEDTWSEVSLEEEIEASRLILIDPTPYVQGRWIGLCPSGSDSFAKDEEPRWRLSQASKLVAGIESKGSPEDALQLLSAGSIAGVDVKKVLEAIEANRTDPSESMVDVFMRMRKSRGMP